jgi:hypothetical protein
LVSWEVRLSVILLIILAALITIIFQLEAIRKILTRAREP